MPTKGQARYMIRGLVRLHPHFKNSAELDVETMNPREAKHWGVFLMCCAILGVRKMNQIV